MPGGSATRPRSRTKPKLPPLFKWIRGVGIAAELFGWGAFMLEGWFWPGVILIYAGFFLLAIDLWVEPDLRGKTGMRIVGVFVIALSAAAFSWGFVFVKAPLEVGAFTTDGEYPPGTTIAGISWKSQFTELQVWINNSTDRNYEDLNLLIRPRFPIAAIAQMTNVPHVSFEDNHAATERLTINRMIKPTVIPLVLLATDAGYRMRCPHLSARTEIKIVIALADVKWNPSPHDPRRSFEETANDEAYVIRVKEDDFSTYWYGRPGADDYTPRPTSSDSIKIEGKYTVAHRVRSLSQWVMVGGNLTISQRP